MLLQGMTRFFLRGLTGWMRLQGEHPHRIWDLIYSQSCFADTATCAEQRILYRLISGRVWCDAYLSRTELVAFSCIVKISRKLESHACCSKIKHA